MKQTSIFEQALTINTNTTTNGTSQFQPAQEPLPDAVSCSMYLTRTGGTSPTLDVKLQVSNDGTTWFDIPSGAFTQQTGATATPGLLFLTLLNLPTAKYIRFVAVTAGTAAATWVLTIIIRLFTKN